MWADVLIAMGAGVLAFVGSRAGMDSTAVLYPAEMVKAAFVPASLLLAGTLERGCQNAKAWREE